MGKSKFFLQNVNKSENTFKHKSHHLKPSTSDSRSGSFFVKPFKPDGQQEVSTESKRTAANTDSKEVKQAKKKPFDKNKWRLQKYSQKSKIDTWKDKRKDYIFHGYRKEQNRQKGVNFDVKKIYEEEEKRAKEEGGQEHNIFEEGTDPKANQQEKRKHFKNISERIREKEAEKETRREEFRKKKEEREEAFKKYKKERAERHKKLNKKTKRGQPVMKGRMEYLLEKIQRNMAT